MARIGVAQVGSRISNTKATFRLMGDWCRKAREAGVQRLVFPEAYIGG